MAGDRPAEEGTPHRHLIPVEHYNGKPDPWPANQFDDVAGKISRQHYHRLTRRPHFANETPGKPPPLRQLQMSTTRPETFTTNNSDFVKKGDDKVQNSATTDMLECRTFLTVRYVQQGWDYDSASWQSCSRPAHQH